MLMDDRGEKIVNLARELLQNHHVSPPADRGNALPTLRLWRKIAMIAVVAAATGGLSVHVMAEQGRPLNRYEKIELQALLDYASRLQDKDSSVLRRDLFARFAITSLDDLTYAHFEEARLYLQHRVRD